MDYETADGSRFSLVEMFTGLPHEEDREFEYTDVAALFEGKAYTAKSYQRADAIDQFAILEELELVNPENIYPLMQNHFTFAPPFDPARHYLKVPSYTYVDCQPGRTMVAECLLQEIATLERLKNHPHPGIILYHGCVVDMGRVVGLCMERCSITLRALAEGPGIKEDDKLRMLREIEDGINHLHDLGFAHNDINPDNICISADGQSAVIIDFDSCIPVGQPMVKGSGLTRDEDGRYISDTQNDFDRMNMLQAFFEEVPPPAEPSGRFQRRNPGDTYSPPIGPPF